VGTGGVSVGGYSAINSSGQFVGAGVVCTGYGISAAGFNPYISGVQHYGANTTFVIGSTTYYVRGGVVCTS
jgi:hypothetical protein